MHAYTYYVEKTACTNKISTDGTECIDTCASGLVSPTDAKQCISRCPEGYQERYHKCELCPIFWDRRTKVCVAQCRYLQRANRQVCEDPEDAVFCSTMEPLGGADHVYLCSPECTSGLAGVYCPEKRCPNTQYNNSGTCANTCEKYSFNGDCVDEIPKDALFVIPTKTWQELVLFCDTGVKIYISGQGYCFRCGSGEIPLVGMAGEAECIPENDCSAT